jgi:hypothetical protein
LRNEVADRLSWVIDVVHKRRIAVVSGIISNLNHAPVYWFTYPKADVGNSLFSRFTPEASRARLAAPPMSLDEGV